MQMVKNVLQVLHPQDLIITNKNKNSFKKLEAILSLSSLMKVKSLRRDKESEKSMISTTKRDAQ
jgi:hypothetical protein